MSYNNPSIPAKSNPKLIDAALNQVNSLLSQLTWLNNRFGKCEDLIDGKGREEKRFPAIYTGSKYEKGYLKLFPDSRLQNFSYFYITNQNIKVIPHQGQLITFDFGLIFWFNIEDIYPSDYKNKSIENVKSEVIDILNVGVMSDVMIRLNNIQELASDIYRGFSFSEIDNQFLMRPYSGFRINGNMRYLEPICEVVPSELPLDVYTGSVAAYSLYKMSEVASNVVRVRRGESGAEQDFTSDEIFDGTLTSWVGSGDGYITTLYDQSGYNNHAVQSEESKQPQIVDSGNLITNNGYECWRYDGIDDTLTASVPNVVGDMLIASTDGSDFFQVAITSGEYELIPNSTKYPLNSVAHIVWGRTLNSGEQGDILTFFDNKIGVSFDGISDFENYFALRSEITEFPNIETSSGIDFDRAWYGCSSLVSFPDIDLSLGNSFANTWAFCTSLRDFPAAMFDNSTVVDFATTWLNTNLSSDSIENIVVSLDSANQTDGTLNISSVGLPSDTSEIAKASIDNLIIKRWNVSVPDAYSGSDYALHRLRVETDGGVMYSTRTCTESAINKLIEL